MYLFVKYFILKSINKKLGILLLLLDYSIKFSQVIVYLQLAFFFFLFNVMLRKSYRKYSGKSNIFKQEICL